MQVQLAEIKNKLSEYVREAQSGKVFEITVRGVAVAQLVPISKPSHKTGFANRVFKHMDSDRAPAFDVAAALQEGRK